MIPGQHHIIKETSESIGELLKTQFKEIGYKRVHLVVVGVLGVVARERAQLARERLAP